MFQEIGPWSSQVTCAEPCHGLDCVLCEFFVGFGRLVLGWTVSTCILFAGGWRVFAGILFCTYGYAVLFLEITQWVAFVLAEPPMATSDTSATSSQGFSLTSGTSNSPANKRRSSSFRYRVLGGVGRRRGAEGGTEGDLQHCGQQANSSLRDVGLQGVCHQELFFLSLSHPSLSALSLSLSLHSVSSSSSLSLSLSLSLSALSTENIVPFSLSLAVCHL